MEEGELTAREIDPPHSTVFTMHPGDLVGVAALLEREPFKYELVASKDSFIIVVGEECMESELKRLPLWLLALIRSLSSKTHLLKKAAVATRVQNTLKSLAEYLSRKPQKKEFNLAELIREYCWLTKVSTACAQEDFKSLFRRHLVKLSPKAGRIFCSIPDTQLMSILVDYLDSSESASYEPYKLTVAQKRILVLLSTVEDSLVQSDPAWIAFMQQTVKGLDVPQWIHLLKLGWFCKQGDNYFVHKERVKYFLKALRYESNIRGVL